MPMVFFKVKNITKMRLQIAAYEAIPVNCATSCSPPALAPKIPTASVPHTHTK